MFYYSIKFIYSGPTRRGQPKMLDRWDVEQPASAEGDPQQRMIALQPSELTSSVNARPNPFLKGNQHTIYSWQPTILQLWKRPMGRRMIQRMSKQQHPQRRRYQKSWRSCSTLHVIYSKFTSPRMILALICQRWSKRRRRESSRRLMGPCPIWLHTWRSCNFQGQLWTLFCLPRLRSGELHRWGDIFCWVHRTTNYALCWIKLKTFASHHITVRCTSKTIPYLDCSSWLECSSNPLEWPYMASLPSLPEICES